MEDKDVCMDLNGYPMNFKYQPDYTLYGSEYNGYKSWNQEAFFYEFVVQNYDLSFKYHGQMYYLLREKGHASVCDEHFTEEYVTFESGNDLIEQFEIEGVKLIDLIDQLEDVDIW